jgi:glycosyltransferase involved in cell wall biosynthesis
MLAYHFPPLGGAGVQRLTQLARRLPGLGWELAVITGPGKPDSRWRPQDERLELEGRGLRIHRLPGPEPPHDVRWEGRLERWLRRPSRWRSWWHEQVLHVVESLDEDVDLVHASLAPYSTAECAVEVARRLGKPLLLDLEDPWALDEMMVYPTRLHRSLERRRMGRVLRRADAVVMNTPEARKRVLEAFGSLPAARVQAIPNAFDPDDFAGGPVRDGDGRFRIVHTGSLHTDAGRRHRSRGRLRRLLGGSEPGVDFLTRSHVFLLEAVAALRERNAALGGSIEVHLAGVFTAEDRAVAADRPFVHLHEFLPHDETIRLLQSADLLFLPLHDLPPGRRATIVPHKTYEYLGAGRPILAAVPAGDARDLLEASGLARLCAPSDVAAMAAVIGGELERGHAGGPPPARAEVVAACTSARLSDDVARLYAALASTS